jgi:hypothetical protein
MKRRQCRGGGGRFVRNTPERVFGLSLNIHDGPKPDGVWCGGFNPAPVGQPGPERCGHCGAPLWPEAKKEA